MKTITLNRYKRLCHLNDEWKKSPNIFFRQFYFEAYQNIISALERAIKESEGNEKLMLKLLNKYLKELYIKDEQISYLINKFIL
jgi:hypothetical protein